MRSCATDFSRIPKQLLGCSTFLRRRPGQSSCSTAGSSSRGLPSCDGAEPRLPNALPKSSLGGLGFNVRTDHRQSKKRRDIATVCILPNRPDIVCTGVWRIFLLLLNIDLHGDWIRLRIEALANTGVQESTFCQGNDIRLVLRQRYSIGLGGQINTSLTHLSQPKLAFSLRPGVQRR